VAAALRERGVGFVGDVAAQSVQRDGSLLLRSGRSLAADAVIAGPQLRGRWITGVPADKWGFVPVETDGRVIGMPHVYAAGDVSDYPVKQAGLATQQADVVADRIARSFGVTGPAREIQRVLRARLVGGDQPLYLRAELDAEGQATGRAQARAASPEEAALPKVFARHLTPYLADREPDLLRANG
jgi:sulfide:quinone oxidoreductase